PCERFGDIAIVPPPSRRRVHRGNSPLAAATRSVGPATFEAAGSSRRRPRVGHGQHHASRHLRGGGFIEAEQERYALLGYLRGPGTFEAAGSSRHTDAGGRKLPRA